MPSYNDRWTMSGQDTPYGRIYLEHGHKWRKNRERQELDVQWKAYRDSLPE